MIPKEAVPSRSRKGVTFVRWPAIAIVLAALGGPSAAQGPMRIRLVSGESRSEVLRQGTIPLESVIAIRTTPPLEFPIRVTVDESDRTKLLLTVPPATPDGEYVVDLATRDQDGHVLSIALTVTVDAVTVPHTAPTGRPPVILLNGWQALCTNTGSSLGDSVDTFGQLATLLQSDGVPVLFFNNCTYGDISIETLAAQLGLYISNLRYSDGTSVSQVDLVGHSMGGLIARAYLSGKSQTPGVFNPPPDPKVRKLILIASPNFGSFQAVAGIQAGEMNLGSQFLWDLGTWNQGRDDLRGVDALAVIGDAGSWQTSLNASDGVVSLTSASLRFAAPDSRTRIIRYCHTTPGFFASFGMSCSGAGGIAKVLYRSDDNGRVILSFLADTADWQTVGNTPTQNSYLGSNAGVIFAMVDANGNTLSDVSAVSFGTQNSSLARGPASYFYSEWLPTGTNSLNAFERGSGYTSTYTATGGGYQPFTMKFGPMVSGMWPAAGLVYYAQSSSNVVASSDVAPGSVVSIYGSNLAPTTASASSLPLPNTLGGAVVTVNGQSVPLLYASSHQINAYLPETLSGLVKLQVVNSSGLARSNVLLTGVAPAIFTVDGSGTGPAGALHALSGQPVTASNPAAIGEYVSLFVTGLGRTSQSAGLSRVVAPVSVVLYPNTIVSPSFAGLAPGFVGLYQVNFQIPSSAPKGLSVPVGLVSGSYFSDPRVTVAIR